MCVEPNHTPGQKRKTKDGCPGKTNHEYPWWSLNQGEPSQFCVGLMVIRLNSTGEHFANYLAKQDEHA